MRSSSPSRRSFDFIMRFHVYKDVVYFQSEDVKLPSNDIEELKKQLSFRDKVMPLEDYLKVFDVTCSVLQSESALKRVAFELAEDCHSENCWYIEVRFCPQLHRAKGLSSEAVCEAVMSGLSAAQQKYGIDWRLIICALRHEQPKHSMEMAEVAIKYKGRVAGFDLAGAENGHPAKVHQAAFALVQKHGIGVTIHAGEAAGSCSVSQALYTCGARRIGHGCTLPQDEQLTTFFNDHRVPIECCPTSNLQTGAVKSMEAHPLKRLLELGLRVTVNTDNRLLSDTTVSKELFLCHTRLGLGALSLRKLIVNGFKSSFLPLNEKRQILQRLNPVLDELFRA